MRNTKYFDLNIFDEDVELPKEPQRDVTGGNTFLSRSLSTDQRAISQSLNIRKISLAAEKWQQVCQENDSSLNAFFREIVGMEFINDDFHPFRGGKFWQMMDYLDGNFISRQENPGETRSSYQDRIIMDGFLGGGRGAELLQTGWDLAINSALLSDIMPNQRINGSTYLLEHVIGDNGSLFYPSVTNEFQTRVVNEAFWQSLFDFYQRNNLDALESTLTKYHEELDPTLGQDNVLRLSQFNAHCAPSLDNPLVSGYSGADSFQGLSRRAIENYGSFISKVSALYTGFPGDLDPFIKLYVDAVNCTDSDGIEYFQESERKGLLDKHFVERVMEPVS
jgi:hypothetical protein